MTTFGSIEKLKVACDNKESDIKEPGSWGALGQEIGRPDSERHFLDLRLPHVGPSLAGHTATDGRQSAAVTVVCPAISKSQDMRLEFVFLA